jgi:hypothetical protein
VTSHDATGGPFDVDAVAAALRWSIGRSPRQADQTADRELLRELVAHIDPGPDGSRRALDARLDALLARLAASGEIADHCAPRHRAWVDDVARIYFCAADDLPEDLRRRIDSETVLAHLPDGVSNRARAAALALGIEPNVIRVRREPVVLEAAAAALVARLPTVVAPAPPAVPDPVVPAPPPPVTAVDPPPADPVLVDPAPDGSHRTRRLALVAAGLLLIVAVIAAVALVGGDEDADDRTGPSRPTAALAEAPALTSPVVVLGQDDQGALVAVTDDGVVPLGLDGVATADAARDGAIVHVVAERHDGHLAYVAIGQEAAEWVDLGVGRAATVGATTAGTAIVVAVTGPDARLVRRSIGRDGRPDGDWERLSATNVVDVDLTANLDGRLEAGGVTADGTAFNVWQSEPPDGWSAYSDERGGTDGVRAELLTNLDGRLELFVERTDGSLWNTWQVAQGRGWTDVWDPRYLTDLRHWRVAVGAEGRLVAVALTDDGAVLRRQIPVAQLDGTTKLMWPGSTVFEMLDLLGGPEPTAVTVTGGDEEALVVATGAGRTRAAVVGLDGLGPVRALAEVDLAALIAVDG